MTFCNFVFFSKIIIVFLSVVFKFIKFQSSRRTVHTARTQSPYQTSVSNIKCNVRASSNTSVHHNNWDLGLKKPEPENQSCMSTTFLCCYDDNFTYFTKWLGLHEKYLFRVVILQSKTCCCIYFGMNKFAFQNGYYAVFQNGSSRLRSFYVK